jgi:hypothetical protein
MLCAASSIPASPRTHNWKPRVSADSSAAAVPTSAAAPVPQSAAIAILGSMVFLIIAIIVVLVQITFVDPTTATDLPTIASEHLART